MELFPVISKSRSETAKGVCRTDDNRIPDLFSGIEGCVYRVDSDGLCNRDVDFYVKSVTTIPKDNVDKYQEGNYHSMPLQTSLGPH